METATETKWQIHFQTPEMVAKGHIQAGRVFKIRENAEREAAKIRTREGWTAEIRPKA
jgi:hypothetical protein